MEFTTSNLINIGAYLITLGIFVGTIKTQFGNLQNQLSSQRTLTMQISNFRKEKLKSIIQVIRQDLQIRTRSMCIKRSTTQRGVFMKELKKIN